MEEGMQYVALFRGINVGGKNVVKMYDLKQLFTELGMYNVKTYIQSGNVVFESDSDKASLHSVIYKGFANRFGFESDVMIRDVNEMTDLIKLFLFSEVEISSAEAADPEVEHIYVYFLDHLDSKLIDDMCKEFAGPDIIRPGKNEIYLLCHQSIRKSKLAIRIAKIFNSATARNWKTVNKLYNLMDTMIP
jgi:uncharacterized protein (DUF1697 family)